jgi:hypothetical protein
MKKMFSYAAQASAGTITSPLKPTKSACLTYFHFEDDSRIYNLIQNAQVNLQHCIDGYDKSVLLKEDFNSVGQTKPTEVKKPNKVIFLNQLVDLVNDGYWVDVRIFAHGAPGKIYMNNDLVLTPQDLIDAKKETKHGIFTIRSAYGCNCDGSSFNKTWIDIGAIVAGFARATNFYPNQCNKFHDEWEKGNVTFKDAVERSDTESSRTVMQALIAADAASQLFPKDWDKCPIGSTVLGDKPCAKSYFSARWGLGDNWQAGKSGKENMNYASEIIIAGQNITRNNKDVLVWKA